MKRVFPTNAAPAAAGKPVTAESRNSSRQSVRADFASAGGFLNTWKKTRLFSPARSAKVLGRFEHGRGVRRRGIKGAQADIPRTAQDNSHVFGAPASAGLNPFCTRLNP